jgi:hypothetical protein
MRTPRWASAAVLLAIALPLAAAPPPSGSFVGLFQIPATLSNPVGVTNAGDGSGRLFIVEQAGRIRIFDGSQMLATPFLDVASLVSCCGERGLLGLAFHPSYKTNGFFYIYYTRANGDIQIARYHVSANPDVADSASGTVLLTIPHSSQANHNGGQLAFGPDGYLYIGVGDGGGGGDPFESGQSVNTLLGKILRIDVDHGSPYAIPAGNPFAGPAAGLDEIWSYGLRNPWRFSFDRQTGDLYIGDVGQDAREEVDFQAAGAAGGRNYGWDCREGTQPYNDTSDTVNHPPVYNADCPGRTFVEPVLDFGHGPECSVTGGYVYRGRVQSFLTGKYVFSDYCGGKIWSTSQAGGWTRQQLPVPVNPQVTSFGESETGRIYVAYAGGTLDWLSPYTFQDVLPTHWSWPYVEAMFASGITLGCDTTPSYCPDTTATRADIAVFLVRGIHGAGFTPPPATGVFADVPTTHRAAAYIEQLYHDGITNGCATSPLRYCPDVTVMRADIAPFLVRVRHGAGYTPPAVGSTSFADVPPDFWAAPWIEQLFRDGISNGCALSPRRYCPSSDVTRAEAAGFIAKTFNLPLP